MIEPAPVHLLGFIPALHYTDALLMVSAVKVSLCRSQSITGPYLSTDRLPLITAGSPGFTGTSAVDNQRSAEP